MPTAAEGGRIGAFNGGIQGLMPQQGFMPQPGLDPRMGYADGLTVAEKTPLYIDPNTELPLHNIEKEIQLSHG